MLIGSAGAMVGALLMFPQGGVLLHEAWHTVLAEGDAVQKQVTVPMLEAVDSFPFGIVLVIFAYGIAIASCSRCRKATANNCRPGSRSVAWGSSTPLGRGGHRGVDRDLRPHRGASILLISVAL